MQINWAYFLIQTTQNPANNTRTHVQTVKKKYCFIWCLFRIGTSMWFLTGCPCVQCECLQFRSLGPFAVAMLALDMGKRTDLLVCHIPFHGKSNFWHERGVSARWLKGLSVQSQRSVRPRRGNVHPSSYVKIHILVQTYMCGSKDSVASNTIVFWVCVWGREWMTDSICADIAWGSSQGYVRSAALSSSVLNMLFPLFSSWAPRRALV